MELKPILHIEKDNVAGSAHYYPEWDAIKRTTDVCSLEYDIEKYQSFLPVGTIPQEGDTYILEPFTKEKYMKVEDYQNHVLKMKQTYISEIAGLLGAKSYSFKMETSSVKERKIEADGSVSNLAFEADAKFRQEKTEALNKRFHMEMEFQSPQIPSIDTYETAVKKAKEYGLYSELEIQNLLNKRQPGSTNPMSEFHIRFSVSEELNNNMDMAFNLKLFKTFKASAQFEETIKYRYEIIGVLDVSF